MLDIIYREKRNQQTANRYRVRSTEWSLHTVLGTIIWTIAITYRLNEIEDDFIQLLLSFVRS